MNSTTKNCTKCHENIPDTEEFFYLDMAKVRLGHTVVLSASCKECKKKQRREAGVIRRKTLRDIGSSEYQLKKAKDPDYLKKHKELSKRYKDRINERNRIRYQTRGHLRGYHKAHRSAIHKREAEELSDYYCARLIVKKSTLSTDEILANKDLIELQRIKTKLHRLLYPNHGHRKCRQIPSE